MHTKPCVMKYQQTNKAMYVCIYVSMYVMLLLAYIESIAEAGRGLLPPPFACLPTIYIGCRYITDRNKHYSKPSS